MGHSQRLSKLFQSLASTLSLQALILIWPWSGKESLPSGHFLSTTSLRIRYQGLSSEATSSIKVSKLMTSWPAKSSTMVSLAQISLAPTVLSKSPSSSLGLMKHSQRSSKLSLLADRHRTSTQQQILSGSSSVSRNCTTFHNLCLVQKQFLPRAISASNIQFWELLWLSTKICNNSFTTEITLLYDILIEVTIMWLLRYRARQILRKLPNGSYTFTLRTYLGSKVKSMCKIQPCSKCLRLLALEVIFSFMTCLIAFHMTQIIEL